MYQVQHSSHAVEMWDLDEIEQEEQRPLECLDLCEDCSQQENQRIATANFDCLFYINPYTTPEKALEILMSPCYSLEALRKEGTEPGKLFLAYMRFITTRLPDGCVDGIWEELFNKTIMYCRNLSYFNIVYEMSITIRIWLSEALSSNSKCPNPYIRLELFHLLRRFTDLEREKFVVNNLILSVLFIQTIRDIQSLHFHPSHVMGEILFDIADLRFFTEVCFMVGEIQEIIFSDTVEQFTVDKEMIVKSNTPVFLDNFIHLIETVATIASSNTDSQKQKLELLQCCNLFNDIIESMENYPHIPGVTSKEKFRHYLMSRPSFQSYFNYLPRILQSSQINGQPALFRQRSLLLRKMSENDNIVEDSFLPFERNEQQFFKRYHWY